MIELIIIIAILFFGCKYILFNVKINSVIFIVFGILAMFLKPPLVNISAFSVILILINIADCIYDMVISDDFYKDMSDGIDGYFAAKSLAATALLLLGWFAWDKNFIYAFLPRAVFLCIVQPLIAASVKDDIRGTIESGKPLPYSKWQYSSSKKENYYYQRFIQQFFDEGKLVTNIKTILREREISLERMDKKLPETHFEKAKDFFKKDEQIQKFKEEFSDVAIRRYAAYIGVETFNQYGKRIEAVLEAKQESYLPAKIKTFSELRDLNLTAPNGLCGDTRWSEFFIIEAMKKLIHNGSSVQDLQDGEDFQKEKIIDDPFKNHVYGVSIKSFNHDDDQLFADL